MSTKEIKYDIHGGPSFATVEVFLEEGEKIVAESGAMAYADGHVDMQTKIQGGFFQALKRKLTGESMFQNTFTGPGMIAFNSQFPGDIKPLEMTPDSGGWILTKDAFIAGTENVKVSGKWGGFKSMFGGEGLFLTYLKSDLGKGIAFAGSYGAIQKHEIPPGEEFVIDNGLFFATSENTEFRISKVGGLKSFFFGGEGLVMRFYGPAVVLTQSRSLNPLINTIVGRIPKR